MILDLKTDLVERDGGQFLLRKGTAKCRWKVDRQLPEKKFSFWLLNGTSLIGYRHNEKCTHE